MQYYPPKANKSITFDLQTFCFSSTFLLLETMATLTPANYAKLKTHLRLAMKRLNLTGKKKAELAFKSRKEIADYLTQGIVDPIVDRNFANYLHSFFLKVK